ncbi:MAG: hypothetical protein PHI59_06685, partial [Candidatus Omnitrophica bacterium]|nr:hypothetical protein [Candidatus Omnitrophota bacterium]
IQKYPASNTAKAAHLALAEFYILHKKYDRAVSTLNTIINKAGKEETLLLSQAYFLRGNAYEIQNQWNKALQEYTILRDKYTDTPLGLQMSMYIAAYYARIGQEEKANTALREAAVFYEKLARDNKGKVIGYRALNLLRDAYLNLKEYEKAGEAVSNTINDYFSQAALVEQLPYVDAIYVSTLKTPEKAVEIYKSIEEKTKDKKLKEILNKKIDALKSGKTGKALSK